MLENLFSVFSAINNKLSQHFCTGGRDDGVGTQKSFLLACSFAQVQMSEVQLQLNQNTKTTVSSSAVSGYSAEKIG